MRKLRARSTQSKGASEETEPGAAQFQHFISSHTARERGEAQTLSRSKPQLYDQGFGSSAKALIQERVYLSMLFLLKTGEWFFFFFPLKNTQFSSDVNFKCIFVRKSGLLVKL